MLPPRAVISALALVLATISVAADSNLASYVDQYRYKLVKLEQDLWNSVIREQSNSISSEDRPELTLIRAYKQFGDELEAVMPLDIDDGLQTLSGVWIYTRTYSELRSVYAQYNAFRRFQNQQVGENRQPSPKQAWIDLAETIMTDAKSSVPSTLRKINELVQDKLFQQSLTGTVFNVCELKQSANQVLYRLYNSVAWTQLKGYAMIQFSLQLFKRFNNKGNFTNEATLTRHKYHANALATADAAKMVLRQASRELWKCDPGVHVQGQTYTEITQLLQGYIENEIDLSASTSCMKTCGYYEYAQSNRCYKNGYCGRQQRCRGKVINCQYIDSDMWVCPADPGSSRRYEYVEYENHRVLGRKLGCRQGTTKVDSWWRYLFWHCSYCMCLCDDPTTSDRYFNLREYVSDTSNQRVVTGLKFVKHNRIIHLQIQEGQLLPHGRVDSRSTRWKPVHGYRLQDRNVRPGQDYHALSWEKRDLDLDDVVLPDTYVMTGVRFRLVGTHLNLEVRATPFNYTTGTLVDPERTSYWHSNDDEPMKRNKLRLENPDVPTRTPQPSQRDSKSGDYVEFTNTDLDRDAAQTTVPFIDVQPVQSEMAGPLSGAGIYHKGRTNFGGFVAPKLITYDHAKHIQVELPPGPDPDGDDFGLDDVNTH